MSIEVLTQLQMDAGYKLDRYGERYILSDPATADGTEKATAIYMEDESQTIAVGRGYYFIELDRQTLQWLFSEAIDRGWYDDSCTY